MNDRLTISHTPIITPIAVFVMGLALLAALALGYGLRTWTATAPSASHAVSTSVRHVEPTRAPEGGARAPAPAVGTEDQTQFPRRGGKPW
jgi:hypothetical protein